MNGVGFEPGDFIAGRFAQPEDDVPGADEGLAVGGDGGTGFGVGIINKPGGEAEASFDLNLSAELDQFTDAVWRQGRAGFARMCLAWNGDFHDWKLDIHYQ